MLEKPRLLAVLRTVVDNQPVPVGLGARDVHLGGEADHGDAARIAQGGDRVVPVGAVDDHGIGLAVTRAAPRRGGQVDVERGEVGAGQVVDGDGVGSAQGVDVDPLDAVEVHRDVAHVAGQAGTLAVGG